jgi:hypothetical protein
MRLGCTSLAESFESIVHPLYVPVQQRLRDSSLLLRHAREVFSSFVSASAVSLSRILFEEHQISLSVCVPAEYILTARAFHSGISIPGHHLPLEPHHATGLLFTLRV